MPPTPNVARHQRRNDPFAGRTATDGRIEIKKPAALAGVVDRIDRDCAVNGGKIGACGDCLCHQARAQPRSRLPRVTNRVKRMHVASGSILRLKKFAGSEQHHDPAGRMQRHLGCRSNGLNFAASIFRQEKWRSAIGAIKCSGGVQVELPEVSPVISRVHGNDIACGELNACWRAKAVGFGGGTNAGIDLRQRTRREVVDEQIRSSRRTTITLPQIATQCPAAVLPITGFEKL